MALDLCKIGQLLRETREKKGLTFEEVSNALFIRKRVVGAIEAGDWDNLPHPVYVKGYVTHYATFLDIPGLLRDEVASTESELASQSSATGSVPFVKDRPLSRRFEAAADEASTIKAENIWRSIVTTSTSKLHELCQKCLLL
jgi:cytoskeletal protein RodZ